MKYSTFLLLLSPLLLLPGCSSNVNLPEELQGIWYEDKYEEVPILGESSKRFSKVQGSKQVLKINQLNGKAFIYKSFGWVMELGEEPAEWRDSFELKKENGEQWYFKYGDRKVKFQLNENKELAITGLSMRVYNPELIKKDPEPATSLYIKLTEQLRKELAADTVNKRHLSNPYEMIYENYFKKGSYQLSSDISTSTGSNSNTGSNFNVQNLKKNRDYFKFCFEYRPITLGDRLESVIIDSFININNPSVRNPFGNNTDTDNRFVIDSIPVTTNEFSYPKVCSDERITTKEGNYEYYITAKIELSNGTTQIVRSKRKIIIRPY